MIKQPVPLSYKQAVQSNNKLSKRGKNVTACCPKSGCGAKKKKRRNGAWLLCPRELEKKMELGVGNSPLQYIYILYI